MPQLAMLKGRLGPMIREGCYALHDEESASSQHGQLFAHVVIFKWIVRWVSKAIDFGLRYRRTSRL